MGKLATVTAWVMLGLAFFVLGTVMPRGQSGWPAVLVLVFFGWSLQPRNRWATFNLAAPTPSTPLRAVWMLHMFSLVAWTGGATMRFLQSGNLSPSGIMNSALCLVIGLSFLAVLELVWPKRRLRAIVAVTFSVVIVAAFFAPQRFAFPNHITTGLKLLFAVVLVGYLVLLVTMVVAHRAKKSVVPSDN